MEVFEDRQHFSNKYGTLMGLFCPNFGLQLRSDSLSGTGTAIRKDVTLQKTVRNKDIVNS